MVKEYERGVERVGWREAEWGDIFGYDKGDGDVVPQ